MSDEALSDEVGARLASLEADYAALEAANAVLTAKLAAVRTERDTLREAYTATKLELLLMKKRLFVAKAERVDVSQLELEFAAKLAELDVLSKRLEPLPPDLVPPPPPGGAKTKKSKGRRDFSEVDLPEEKLVLADPAREGQVPRKGFDVSYRVMWRRGGLVRVRFERVKYEEPSPEKESGMAIVLAPMPPDLFPGSLATPSLVAHLAVAKYCDGMPLHRLEQALERDGARLDRSTMGRWLEHAGATLGATVLTAAREHALRTSFGCATDATGVAVQPHHGDMKKKQPCRRGHFFVQLFDKQHVFFEYVPRETSDAVVELFKGFSGMVQADAKSVYDVLFRPPADEEEATCTEVGCWCHARRKFWEAAIAHCAVSREALVRIQRLFENEAKFKGLPPEAVARLRAERSRPLVDAFFDWAKPEYEKVKNETVRNFVEVVRSQAGKRSPNMTAK